METIAEDQETEYELGESFLIIIRSYLNKFTMFFVILFENS